MTAGRSLNLYFIDGKPDGMLTAEVFNWTGHVLKFPRLQISEALKRSEVANTGVYILLGPIDGIDTAYIGESESVKGRMLDHESKKDWWEHAIVITSAGNGLHKAHVKYLESRLVEIAQNVGHTPLENGTKPAKPSISEADISNMEGFLDTLMMVLPAIRVDMFMQKKRGATIHTPSPEITPSPTFEFEVKKHGIKAAAKLEGGEFIVQAGSNAQISWIGSEGHNYRKLHSELIASGVIATQGHIGVFTENYAFSSTSAAAAIVSGRAANGPKHWIVQGSGKSYREWETQLIAAQYSGTE